MRKYLQILFLLVAVSSCDAVSFLIHDEDVVAKVGKHKLYRSEVERFIPDMISPEDSASLAAQYVNSWATDLLYMEIAESQLSKPELDVTEDLETYRRSLIKYRYEQRYIGDRLDTLVTAEQMKAYYDAHSAEFQLSRPVLKVRFVDIMKDSPNREKILARMASSDIEDVREADTLARAYALRYFDSSDTWMDAAELARYFGVDYTAMMANLWEGTIRIEPADRGDVLVAHVCDLQRSGTAPLEYSEQRIRDIILSNRKHELLKSLEQDLLDDALERKQFVIYQ